MTFTNLLLLSLVPFSKMQGVEKVLQIHVKRSF